MSLASHAKVCFAAVQSLHHMQKYALQRFNLCTTCKSMLCNSSISASHAKVCFAAVRGAWPLMCDEDAGGEGGEHILIQELEYVFKKNVFITHKLKVL